MKYVIDPGHGGRDPGAVGGHLLESHVVLDLALRVEWCLKELKQTVALTRRDDTRPSWRARVSPAAKEDIFISIHCNAAENPQAHGMEVFHYPGSAGGAYLATAIHSQLAAIPGLADRGIKTGTWYVLRKTPCPAILVECAFISNANDRAIHLSTNVGRQRLAEAIARGAMLGT